MAVSRSNVVSSAREFLGTPWAHAARLKNVGVDCTGLVICAFNENGAEIPDKFDYSLGDEFVGLVRILNKYFSKHKLQNRRAGDVLLFRAKDMYNHVGLMVDEQHFVHAYSDPAFNRVVLTKFDGYWKQRLSAVYSFKGFEE